MSESSENNPSSPGGNGIRRRQGLGGPSTPEGKAKTKFNATTHGIFSSVVVLKGETRADYESLLSGLWADCRPQGQLEEILVEKLAMVLWRHRRLLVSERGEISKGHQYLTWEKDRSLQEAVGGEFISRFKDGGLQRRTIRDTSSLKMLDHFLGLFVKLRDGIASNGFQRYPDGDILKEIYGSEWQNIEVGGSYAKWYNLSPSAGKMPKKSGPTPETCRDNLLSEIDLEIKRLKQIREEYEPRETKRRSIEILRRHVPEGPELERLLRYEASLERAFDRTLAQLERAQRLRLGQPVPPRLEVNVTQ